MIVSPGPRAKVPRRPERLAGRAGPVLLVDDDVHIVRSMTHCLEDEGYTTLFAGDGQQAIEVLATSAVPALILLDLMMPVMNGWELCRWLQAQPALVATPVVLLSATSMVETSAACLGVAGYLRKPVRSEQLLETVARFLGCPGEPPAP